MNKYLLKAHTTTIAKRNLMLLIAVFMMPMIYLNLEAQSNSDYWYVNNVQLEKSSLDEQVMVAFTIKPSDKIRSQAVVYIYPYLESQDGRYQYALEKIVIAGKGRYNIMGRQEYLNNKSSNLPNVPFSQVLNVANVSDEGITVREMIPYKQWMKQSVLKLREEVYGCAACEVYEGVNELAKINVPNFGPEYYAFNFIEPKRVIDKEYEEEFECKVNFEVARHELKTNYKNNATELQRLNDFVNRALSLPGATLKKVYVFGYASPEAEFNYNKALAERRANVLAEYAKSNHPHISKVPSMIVTGIGEDWVGLRNAVEDSDMQYKTEVLKAIDAHSTDVKRENDIKVLDGGKVYQYLLNNLYPPLRRTVFKMGYSVRLYNPEELSMIFEMNPELMSLHELYLLAYELDSNGVSPILVYENAYQRFRDKDSIVSLNYANAILKYEKNPDKALSILLPIQDDPRSAFPMAIAYDMKGDTNNSELMLKKAAENGNKIANQFVRE